MNRSDIEMAIVKHLLERAKEFGWVCTKVNNGDGYVRVAEDEVLDEAFAADYADLRFEQEGFRQQWVYLVFGNDGYDVIEGEADGHFFTVAYGRASEGKWPKSWKNVTRKTISDLPDTKEQP